MEWCTSSSLIPYEQAVNFMEDRVKEIARGNASEMVWLLEHPPLYTAGSSAKKADLLDTKGLPVYETGRGGQYTYHGPGQRVVYVMIDLTKRRPDVRVFITALEQWIIDTLGIFGIEGQRRPNRIGIWVTHDGKDKKIAALGIRLHRWVSFHGIAINVHPNLDHFQGIVPCGLSNYDVTSCISLGTPISLSDLDEALYQHWLKNDYLHSSSHPIKQLQFPLTL